MPSVRISTERRCISSIVTPGATLAMTFGGDVGGPLHGRDLFVGVEEAHLVEYRAGVNDRLRRVYVAPAAIAHARHLTDYRQVEFRVAVAEPVVEVSRAVEKLRKL